MTAKTHWVLLLKDFWWLGGMVIVVAGGITFAVTAPRRLEAVEKKNLEQDQILTALKAVEDSNHELMKSLVTKELADDGEIKTLVVDGKKLCCDGTECWPWRKTTLCAR